jgi:lysozyme family protein
MFETAFKETMSHEGLYSNHPSDRGGETYQGIARKFHPDWKGWEIIDKVQDKNSLRHNVVLNNLVKEFYKTFYWDNCSLDSICSVAPKTSLEVFDLAVNMGTSTASKILQRAFNILNRNQTNYKNILVDGNIGPITVSMINKYISDEDYLHRLFVFIKAARYISIVENNESQEVFIRGWLNRVKL